MFYAQVALLVAGVALLAVGYRRNHRNLLLAGAIVLFLSGAGLDFITGFADGVSGAIVDAAK